AIDLDVQPALVYANYALTENATDPFMSCDGATYKGLRTAWFKFTEVAPNTGAVVNLCNSTQNDTVLAIYSSSSATPCSDPSTTMTMIGCADDTCINCPATGACNETLTVSGLTPGQTYYVLVAAFSTSPANQNGDQHVDYAQVP